MSLSRFNFPESPRMMKSRWPWSFGMGVSSAGESPFIVGTPILDWVIRALKESEMETAPEEWQRARVVHECANEFFMRSMNPAEPMPTNTNQNPLDLDEKVLVKNKCTIPGFESIGGPGPDPLDHDDGVPTQCYDHRCPIWRTEPTYR